MQTKKRINIQMRTKDDLFKVELLEDGNYCITIISESEVGQALERIIEDGLDQHIKASIEKKIIDDCNCLYGSHDVDIDLDCFYFMETWDEKKNDKRVINQYDKNYFELIELIKYREYIGDYNIRLNFGQIERLIMDGYCVKEIIEKMIIPEYGYFAAWLNYEEDYLDYIQEMEETEVMEKQYNDERVINQYDENYFELLQWIEYRKYIGDPNMKLDFGQIERLWKLNKIRKIIKGN